MIDGAREDVDEMFETHDKDRDGMLSWAEFSGEETKNEKAFKLMDADHNGKITKSVSLITLVFGRSKWQSIQSKTHIQHFLGTHKENSFSS